MPLWCSGFFVIDLTLKLAPEKSKPSIKVNFSSDKSFFNSISSEFSIPSM